MSGKFNHKSSPNPAKLVQSLRHLGYDNYHAIADLVDNSIDADPENIKIIVRSRKGEPEIIVADDGNGMDEETLDQAIRLGSLSEKDPATDLGKFGMGLCTAALSICKQTTVLTKRVDTTLLKAVTDVAVIERENDFVSVFEPADDDDVVFFEQLLGDSPSGTVVILRDCDHLQNRNLAIFSKILAKNLARIFRYFLASKLNLYVNDTRLMPIDPLEWERAEHFDDGEITVKINDNGEFVFDVIRVKLAILPDDTASGEGAIAQSIKSQGFYILRNNRELLDAVTLDFYTKHNDFNRFRAEIHFSGMLDKYMGVNFTKRNVALHQSLTDQLNEYLRGQLRTIRARVKRAQQAETPSDIMEVHESAESEIQRKSKLLLTPKAPKEVRGVTSERPEKAITDKPGPEHHHREPGEKRQPGGFTANCKFETASMGEAGVIYEADQRGRTVIVRWNSDHPFYKRFVLENVTDKRIVAASDFLVYSLACAELIWFTNEESVELMNNLKTVISSNMRTLLS